MKKFNKKGFTLAELLVVVAIIAILIAVAIPTFGAAQDKARYGVAEANARSAYAEWMIDYIASDDAPGVGDKITYSSGGVDTVCTVSKSTPSGDDLTLNITVTVDGTAVSGPADGGSFEFSSISKNVPKT